MRALILGTGDAFSRTRFGSSAVLEGAPEPSGRRSLILLDCPDSIHRAIDHASARSGWNFAADDIDDIILTHLHGDHCNGLESFAFWRLMLRAQGKRSALPRLHTTQPVADRLWQRLAPAMDALIGLDRPVRLDDYFDLRILSTEQPAAIAGLSIRCRFTTHHIPTIGVLASDGRWTLGWSGDTRWEPAHVEWLDQADVIVHETSPPPAHTPIEHLNGLPDRLRGKMRLIHMPDSFDPACTDIRPLAEGEVLGP